MSDAGEEHRLEIVVSKWVVVGVRSAEVCTISIVPILLVVVRGLHAC